MVIIMTKKFDDKPSLNLLTPQQSHILKWLPKEELARLEERVLQMTYKQYQWLKYGVGNDEEDY